MIPALATLYIPVLLAQLAAYWPAMTPRSLLAAQVEQETCITLKHKRCWSPHAELRTSRERGVGLGQFTKTARFDALQELKDKHPKALADLTWERPYDAELQLRALVLKNRDLYHAIRFADNNRERLAMVLSAYNGGLGGVLKDRRLCANVAGCNPSKWFGHIEKHSTKAKAKVSGYGQSFYHINREYVTNVWGLRRAKYVPIMDAQEQHRD